MSAKKRPTLAGPVDSMATGELQGKIRAWLDEQGYPLEMRVARTFRRAGFRVLQSDYYRDSETEAFRELDVVASLDHRIDDLHLRIQFIIECKSSRSKPWLMFCSRDATLAPTARVVQRTASKVGSKALTRLAQRKEIQELALFQIVEPPAYGATQAFTTGSDIVYSALTGVGNAVSARARELDNLRSSRNRFCIILFPVVVVEGRLFSCVLENDASIAIAEAQRGTLLWRNPVAGEPHTIVSILTERAVRDFADCSIDGARKLFKLGKSEFENAFPPDLFSLPAVE